MTVVPDRDYFDTICAVFFEAHASMRFGVL